MYMQYENREVFEVIDGKSRQNENYELVRKFENGQCFAIFFFFWLQSTSFSYFISYLQNLAYRKFTHIYL